MHHEFTGFAEFSVTVNAAPTGGHLEATPRAGVAALDTFTLESLDWTDDVEDLPLMFSFSYVNGQVSHSSNSTNSCTKIKCQLFGVTKQNQEED